MDPISISAAPPGVYKLKLTAAAARSTLLFADSPVFVSVHLDVRFIDRR